MPPPLPFEALSHNAAGCLSARERHDPEAFSPYIYTPAPGWTMTKLEAMPPFLLVESGTMPLLVKRRKFGGEPQTLVRLHRLLIHWGFWSPEAIFTVERIPDENRALPQWMGVKQKK
jgi:hypothetical protein